MKISFKIGLYVMAIVLSVHAYTQEIKHKFSMSANYGMSYSINFPSGEVGLYNVGMSSGYNLNNYLKPFIGLDYYVFSNSSEYYGGLPNFNRVDGHMGLEARFFKSKCINLVLQTKLGVDVYSNARNKPMKYLRIQDKFYEWSYWNQENSKYVSDGYYKYAIFWSTNLFISFYYKNMELKLGPGCQLNKYKLDRNTEYDEILSINGMLYLTYYFK